MSGSGDPVPVLQGRLADAARVLFIVAAIGSFTSPPVANIAAFLGLCCFFASPGALFALRAAARRPVGRGILVFLGVMALAMLWAEADWNRRFAAWWSWRPLILLLVGTALFAAGRWRERFAVTLVAVLALAALLSFIARFLPTPLGIDEPGILLRNHTTQGMALVVGAILAAMLVWGGTLDRRWRPWLLAAIVLFIANLAVITTGRSAHVALLLAGGLLSFGLVGGRRRWILLFLLPVLGAAVFASSGMVRERFATAYGEFGTVATSPTETSMGLRVVIWSTTRELIARRPLLGYGVGGFAPAYAQLVHQNYTGWQAAEAKDTHNQYLHVMVEAGIPGVLAFLFFLAGVVRQWAPSPYRATALALFGAWLLTSLANSHFQTFAEAHLIGLVLGMLLAGSQAAGEGDASASADPTAASTAS